MERGTGLIGNSACIPVNAKCRGGVGPGLLDASALAVCVRGWVGVGGRQEGGGGMGGETLVPPKREVKTFFEMVVGEIMLIRKINDCLMNYFFNFLVIFVKTIYFFFHFLT